MLTKICKKCGIEKPTDLFRIRKLNKVDNTCKQCALNQDKISRKVKLDNRHEVVTSKECVRCNKIYAIDNFQKDNYRHGGFKPHCKLCDKKYYLENKNKKHEYYQSNKPKIRDKKSKYYLKNKEVYKNRNKAYFSLLSSQKRRREIRYYKYRNDLNFKLASLHRSRIRSAIKGKYKFINSLKLLGCSSQVLKDHLELKFTKGMSWNNHGRYGWHIDHIIPISSFDLSDPKQQAKCFHYTNLQPLWATTEIAVQNGEDSGYIGNLEKSDKLISLSAESY